MRLSTKTANSQCKKGEEEILIIKVWIMTSLKNINKSKNSSIGETTELKNKIVTWDKDFYYIMMECES